MPFIYIKALCAAIATFFINKPYYYGGCSCIFGLLTQKYIIMKKVLLVLFIATIVVSCTKTNLRDDIYENQIKTVDLSKVQRPGTGAGATEAEGE